MDDNKKSYYESIIKENDVSNRLGNDKKALNDFCKRISIFIKDKKFEEKINVMIKDMCSYGNFLIEGNQLYASLNSSSLFLSYSYEGDCTVSYMSSYTSCDKVNEKGVYTLYSDGNYSICYETEKICMNGFTKEYTEIDELYDSKGVQISKEINEINEIICNENTTPYIQKSLYIRNDGKILKLVDKSIFRNGLVENKQCCDYAKQRAYFLSNEAVSNCISDDTEFTEIDFDEYKKNMIDFPFGKINVRQKY